MSSHRSASGPTATRAVSARCTRWVTSRQKSYAGPVTVCAASSGPQVQASPGRSVSATRNSSVGAGSPRTAKEKLRVRMPRCATCRTRSLTSGGTPSAWWTSRECAQVSMKRAVAIEVADIGGPYHGIFWPSG